MFTGFTLALIFIIVPTVTVCLLVKFREDASSHSIKNSTSVNGNSLKDPIKKYIVASEFVKVRKVKRRIPSLKSKEEQYVRCESEAEKLFYHFAKDVIFNLKYNLLFDDIRTLKYHFVSKFAI